MVLSLAAACGSDDGVAPSSAAVGGVTYSIPCQLPDKTVVSLTDYHQGWSYADGIDCLGRTHGLKVEGKPNSDQLAAIAAYGSVGGGPGGMAPMYNKLYLAFSTCADVSADAKYGPASDGPIFGTNLEDVKAARALCPDHKYAVIWDGLISKGVPTSSS